MLSRNNCANGKKGVRAELVLNQQARVQVSERQTQTALNRGCCFFLLLFSFLPKKKRRKKKKGKIKENNRTSKPEHDQRTTIKSRIQSRVFQNLRNTIQFKQSNTTNGLAPPTMCMFKYSIKDTEIPHLCQVVDRQPTIERLRNRV